MSKEKKSIPHFDNSIGRLVACQALCVYYNENNEDKDILNILESVNEYYIAENFTNENKENLFKDVYSSEFVLNLVNGVLNNADEYDILINEFLQKQDTTGTIDEVLLQAFRLAIYELKNTDIDKNIVVNEYTDIVAEFFDGIYITFANGILDNIATYIKTGEKRIIETKQEDIKKINIPKIKHKRKTITLKINKDKENGK